MTKPSLGAPQMEGVKACVRELLNASETFARLAKNWEGTLMGQAAMKRAEYYSDAAEHLLLAFGLKKREGPTPPEKG